MSNSIKNVSKKSIFTKSPTDPLEASIVLGWKVVEISNEEAQERLRELSIKRLVKRGGVVSTPFSSEVQIFKRVFPLKGDYPHRVKDFSFDLAYQDNYTCFESRSKRKR